MRRNGVPTVALLAVTFCSPTLAQWTQTNGPHGVDGRCFAATGTSLLAGTHGGIIRSTDNGVSWTPSWLANETVNAIGVSTVMDTTAIFAAAGFPEVSPGGLFRSTNEGASWDSINPGGVGLFYSFIVAPDSVGTSLFTGSISGPVFHSTDNGLTWNKADSGLAYNYGVTSFAHCGKALLAGSEDGVIFRSINNGDYWSAFGSGLPPQGDYLVALAVLPMLGGTGNPTLFAAYDFFGIYVSNDSGETWTTANNGLPAGGYIHFAVSGDNIFVSINSGLQDDVYMSTNHGSSWSSISAGLPAGVNVSSLFINGSFIFAGTDTAGVWRRPLAEVVTSIQENGNVKTPTQFLLAQNYPNPFNPTTRIGFSIPVGAYGRTSLRVYNMLGQEVATLVNEELSPGNHETTFDATGLASGMYLYTLRVGSMARTKKLLLVR